MDSLPDLVVWDILNRIERTADRNAVSVTCKRLYNLDNEQRTSIRVGCGLDPANEALKSICSRFINLEKVEIMYSGWMSKLGKQLDDQGLRVLSVNCPSLKEIILSYCAFISDTGLSYLASCSKLSALKLNFAPRITGCGILSLVMSCKKLTVLHLIRCLNINSVEWLEYLGELETLEELCIKNCRSIGEGDLIKLGPTWRRLKRLEFEVDANYRNMKFHDRLAIDRWEKQWIPCDSLLELSLVNCIITPGRGLACILGECKNLEKIHLDMCVGLRDSDFFRLAHKSRNLRSISLRVLSDLALAVLMDNSIPLRLSDDSLKSLADNCSKLEIVKVAFCDAEFPKFSYFSLGGILIFTRKCPIRELSLHQVPLFNDEGMEALVSACYLEKLELVGCQALTDKGLQLVVQIPELTVLQVSKCMVITDAGLKPLVGASKLDMLAVEDCPRISETGVQGAAKSVTFRRDLSWMIYYTYK